MPRAKKKIEEKNVLVEIKKNTDTNEAKDEIGGKKISEDSDIIMEGANVEDSFAKQMIKLLHSKSASIFVMNTMKVIIPKITNSIIVPKECYYDEKENSLNIFFDINASKKYSVGIVVTKSKDNNKTNYDITVKSDDVNYNVIFSEVYTEKTFVEPRDF